MLSSYCSSFEKISMLRRTASFNLMLVTDGEHRRRCSLQSSGAGVEVDLFQRNS